MDKFIILKTEIALRKNVYFIGIGGIGMSALARFFRHEGYVVAGYDRVCSPLTDALEQEGISVHYEDNVKLIPTEFLDRQTTCVIYTPAVPTTHTELHYFRDHGFEVVKRSAVLGLLSRDKWTMAVAGTHGKTSTTTMVAWFNHVGAGEGSAFMGGISKNFGSNMVLGRGDRLAVEADEFDRSFLQLTPQAAVITAADPDHLDIYGTKEEFEMAFAQFADSVTHRLILKKGVEIPTHHKYSRYSLDDPSTDYYARNISLEEGGYYSFDLVTPERIIEGCRLGVPGLVNVENCVAAVALVSQRGYDADRLREAISSFRGVARRFDLWINSPKKVYMDDYAHHPEELGAMIGSVRRMFPGRHITVVFQPHLYSRSRDFQAGFSRALSLADRLLLLPIYPARELPIEGVSSAIIFDDVTIEKEMIEREGVAQRLCELTTDIVVSAGAGDIDRLCADIALVIEQK